MSDEVRVERRGAVQVVTINRPDARNALDASVARGIADAVDELDASAELRAGVLTGAGGSFSAGMDLKAFLRGETPVVGGRGLCGITVTPPRKPLVAAVEGWALAGGFELVLACDLVVAGRTAGFGVPEVTRSLVAAGGAALLPPQRVPRAVALEMLLTGRPIDALPSGAAADGLPDGGNGRRGPVVGTDVERFPLRLVVLGDSIAFGTGALRIEDTLGRRLATALIADGFDVDLHVLAVPGSVSRDLAAQVRRAEPLAADVAVIVIGANDLARFVPPAQAAASLASAVRVLRASGTEVVVVPAPDMSAVPFVPPAFRAAVRAASVQLQRAQATAVESAGGGMAVVSEVGAAFAGDPSLFSADRFHPSSAGYAAIAAALAPAVVAAARTRRDAAAA